MENYKNINQYVNIPSIIFLYLIDKVWSAPRIIDISTAYKKYKLLCKNNKYVEIYFRCMFSDVIEDNPEKAIVIIEKELKIFNNVHFIKYRMAYLYARIGQIQKAKFELKNVFSKKAIVFKECLSKMTCSFTMTDTLYKITKKYGVHKHFGYIETLIRKNKLRRGAEIGVFMGLHSMHMLEACRNLKLYCVDIYGNIDGNGYDSWNNNEFEKLFRKVKSNTRKFERVTFLRMLSKDASNKIKKYYLDFVYIDADHRYQGVKNDLKYWEDKVRPGGIVSGHDYMQKEWPGVKKAVDEWVKKHSYKINICEGYVWWIQK